MHAYTQANRPIRVNTQLGEDVLLLNGFNGQEGVSELFSFQLELASVDPDLDPQAFLRTPVVLTIDLTNGSQRTIHGLARRLTQLGRRDDLVFYRAEIVPWLWFLTLSRECRIYQELSVPEIIDQLFKRLGYYDFEFRLNHSYAPRLFCVQYRETHLNFVSRLLEEEGIFYFFEHARDKHTLVLADAPGAFPDCPAAEVARYTTDASHMEEVVWEMEREHSIQPGKVTLADYDYLQPHLNLVVTLGEEQEEIYDYHPGRYTLPDEGERLVQLLLEAEEAERQVVRGESSMRGFTSGHHFTLQEHYRGDTNAAYVLTQVQHAAHAAQYRAWENDAEIDYRNTFFAIPHGIPYRPPRRTPRPVIRGTQTALVVGPAGEEVHVDPYGRIKVHFYWDRDGKRDENSSCWVRVATPWGGKGWGAVTIPRIGNEVIVAFLEGDPDQPIVVGSVYNADQMPPFGPGIQMGMKSHSSPGGGGYNEITATDTKGKELITIHGQYDMNTTVEHDETVEIRNNRTAKVGVDESVSVGSNQTVSIGSDRTESVGSNETITVGSDRSTSVGGSDTLTVTKTRSHTVGINESITVGAAQEVSVGGMRAVTVGMNQSTTVGQDLSTNVGKDVSTNAGGDRSVTIAKNDTLKVGKKLVINAGDEIVIQTGKASITMKKDGTILINGKDLSLKGSGKMDVKISKDIVMKGKKILQN
jgi:type VI secretion system secreted protein VgrG